MKLTTRDCERLKGIHPDLARVVACAAEMTNVQFMVGEGLRTIERQKMLLAQGATTTLRSRHLTGHAVDLVALDEHGVPTWHWPLYSRIAATMKAAAEQEAVLIEWGGDWLHFKDGPHFQLPWAAYPEHKEQTT